MCLYTYIYAYIVYFHLCLLITRLKLLVDEFTVISQVTMLAALDYTNDYVKIPSKSKVLNDIRTA